MVIKPDTLFHASTSRDIQNVLEPRRCENVGGEVGEFVFATDDRMAAWAYAIKTDDLMCVHYMHIEGLPTLQMCVIKDREKALKNGIEGRIFEVPSDTFRMVLYQGRETYEWVSESPVPVDQTKVHRVTLEDAMKAGIQIFFAPPDADQSLVDTIYESEKKFYEDSKLRGVFTKGTLIWENQLRGIDPISRPELLRPNQALAEAPATNHKKNDTGFTVQN